MRVEVKKLFFKSIGEVKFMKNRRARRLIIKVKHDGNVSVTVPFLVSYTNATSFVRMKMDWIIKTQEHARVNLKPRLVFGESSMYQTRLHTVSVERYNGTSIRSHSCENNVRIRIPEGLEITSSEIQEKIRALIVEVLRKEAKDILPPLVSELAARFGFKFRNIRIKKMKSRWGSCSHNNTINLNLHLVRLPEHLCNYILLHELIHTVHKNHGKGFWNSLESICPDAKILSRELKALKLEMW